MESMYNFIQNEHPKKPARSQNNSIQSHTDENTSFNQGRNKRFTKWELLDQNNQEDKIENTFLVKPAL